MIRTLLCSAAVASLLAAPAAEAWPVHLATTLTSPTCPEGATYAADDNCGNNPSDGVVQYPNFFSATSNGYTPGVARQSGQSPTGYAKRPDFNVAGVDYPVGYSQSKYLGTDSQQLNGVNGCEFEPTTSIFGGPMVECFNSASLDVEGYDFSKTVYNGVTYDCVPIRVHPATGTTTFKNNKFVNGSNCTRIYAHATGYMGDQFYAYAAQGSTTLCVGTVTQGIVEIDPGSGKLTTEFTLSPASGTLSGGTFITAAVGGQGTCAANFTAYTMNQSVPYADIGSSTNPVLFTENSTTVVATVTDGSIANVIGGTGGSGGSTNHALTFQGDVAYLNGDGGADVVSCTPACGGAGSYTITGDTAGFAPTSSALTFGLSQYMLQIDRDSNNSNSVFTQNYVDGNAWDNTAMVASAIILNNSGTVTVQYDAFFRIQARPVSTETVAGLDVEDNYWEAFVLNRAAGHAEILIDAAPVDYVTMPYMIYKNNTINVTANSAQISGASPIFTTTGQTHNTITNLTVTFNTFVVNKNAGIHTMSGVTAELDYGYFTSVTIDHDFIDGVPDAGNQPWCFKSSLGGVGPLTSWIGTNWNMNTGNVEQKTWNTPC